MVYGSAPTVLHILPYHWSLEVQLMFSLVLLIESFLNQPTTADKCITSNICGKFLQPGSLLFYKVNERLNDVTDVSLYHCKQTTNMMSPKSFVFFISLLNHTIGNSKVCNDFNSGRIQWKGDRHNTKNSCSFKTSC